MTAVVDQDKARQSIWWVGRWGYAEKKLNVARQQNWQRPLLEFGILLHNNKPFNNICVVLKRAITWMTTWIIIFSAVNNHV